MISSIDVKEHILAIQKSRNGQYATELNLVSINDEPPKYDIRRWDKATGHMFKGVRLSREEAEAVAKAILDHLQKTKED